MESKIHARRWDDPFARIAIRSAQFVLIVAGLVVAGLMFAQLRVVVVPVLVAMILASATWPLVRYLRARGVGDIPAAAAALAGLAGVMAGLGWIVITGISGEWESLRDGALDGLRELQRWIAEVLPITIGEVADVRDALIGDAPADEARDQAAAGAVALVELLSGIILTLVITFFLLKDGERIGQLMLKRAADPHAARIERIGTRSVDVLGAYVRGTAIVAVVDAVVIGAALMLLGVPLALPLAVVVFLGAFVPLVGATVAGAIAALVALVASGPVTALIVVAVVIAVNQLEGDLLAPVVLGNAVNMHPLAILLTLATGFVLDGVLGALLAVPLFAVAWTAFNAWDDETDPVPDG